MKLTTSILTTAFVLLMAIPSIAAAAPSRYRYAHPDGWPKWVGRINNLYTTVGARPQMHPKYLPLSLIKTGRLQEIIAEVEATPNVDTTGWPSWIGKLRY